MRRSAAFGPALLFALVPFLSACEESEIPIEPEGEPRFTNLVINKLEAEPELDDELDAGPIAYDLEAHYQLSGGWEAEDLDAYLVVESYSNNVFIRREAFDVQEITGETGSFSFDGEFTLADCGDIDLLGFFVVLSTADDLEINADTDFYVVDAQTASAPC